MRAAPCIISHRSPTNTLCRGRPVLQLQAPSASHIIHHPWSSTGLMLINPSSIRLTSLGSTSLDGWERIQWSTSYILSQARLVQVRIRCLLYVNFHAMYSIPKKCNSRFLKIQIILSLIKFIFKKLLTFVSSNRSNDTYFSRIIGYKSKWYTISYNFLKGKLWRSSPRHFNFHLS